jgi:hypothetical protein
MTNTMQVGVLSSGGDSAAFSYMVLSNFAFQPIYLEYMCQIKLLDALLARDDIPDKSRDASSLLHPLLKIKVSETEMEKGTLMLA